MLPKVGTVFGPEDWQQISFVRRRLSTDSLCVSPFFVKRNTPYKQVVVAAADGCIAAMAIDKYLKGRKKIKVDWVHN